jgi:hypothetical protein
VEIGDFGGEWMAHRIEIKEISVQRRDEDGAEEDRTVTIVWLRRLFAYTYGTAHP